MVNTKMVPAKCPTYWWLALLLLCLAPCLTPFACHLDPTAILERIPVGSRLSDLDEYLSRSFDSSSVKEWVTDRPRGGAEHGNNQYGSHYIQNLGEYETWSASKAERDAFTGEISFFHISWVIPDDIAPSYVFSLIYVDGRLTNKDYGVLPG